MWAAYAAPTSSASNYSVSSGKGQLSIPSSNTAREQLLLGGSNPLVRDADPRVRVATDKLPVGTNGEVALSTVLRTIDRQQ